MLALDHPGLKGRPWVHVGQAGPILGLSWGPCWAYVGLCWLSVGPMLAYVSHILAYVGPVLALCWPYVGLCWPHVGPSWGLCWGYVGDMWHHLCWKTSKMPIFPSRIRPGNQKPRKNHGFALSPTKKSACPSTQNTVQNDVFVTSHARNTVKYGDFSRWGWFGGGSTAVRGWVRAASVTTEGPPGSTRARGRRRI